MKIQQALEQLLSKTDLSSEHMSAVMRQVMTGEATPSQIGGFLIALRMKGETVDEVAAAASVMRSLADVVLLGDKSAIDIVGTGGDSTSTFNVSTCSTDPKELAEHLMLIDLGRNDIGRIAETGTVDVTDKFSIERYSHVMHIVSNVVGKLKSGITPMDVLKATFPAGTLSGAPKVRAMEIIQELEPVKRGVYSGAVGYLSWNGNMDTAIAIRTAVVKNGILNVQAGAGIVYDSDPESEWQETHSKARAIFSAVSMAEAGLDTRPAMFDELSSVNVPADQEQI